MIIGRKFSYDNDLYVVNKILKENEIKDIIKKEDIIYVLEIDNEIVGVCKIYINNNISILKYMVISKYNRGENLGDGLLRATFNFCLKIGINTVYYPYINEYLIKKGFNLVKDEYLKNNLINISKDNNLLECNLNSFFDKQCSCKRR